MGFFLVGCNEELSVYMMVVCVYDMITWVLLFCRRWARIWMR